MKRPPQHVTGGYLGSSYPEGNADRTSRGGWQSDLKFGKIGGGVVTIATLCRWRHDRGGEIDISSNWNEVETVPSFRIGGEVIEKEVESEVQEQREERGRGRKSSFENGRGSLGRSWSKMAKRRRLNFELVLVQGCYFNIRMGGVGPFFSKFGPGVNILWYWGRVG